MLHIEYRGRINPELVMVEHHFLSDLLSPDQRTELADQTRSIFNPLHKTDYGFRHMNHVTFMLGFTSAFVLELNEITESNIDEWYYRINMYERLVGCMLSGGTAFSRDDIVAHVGLKVNSAIMTRRKFDSKMKKKYGEIAFDNAKNDYSVKGSDYDSENTGMVEVLKNMKDHYGSALVGTTPKGGK